jgi:hypothetical protein
MDLFCGLPKSEAGYRNILVMTDYVTKYVVAVLLFSKTAEEVAQEFVDKWCLIHGWPERIQTDQGGEFTRNVLKAITEAARVKRSTTTPYHPQANGQVERTNKTIAQMLSKRCYTNQRTWSKILIEIIYEYNCFKHRVTGWTPFYMTYGRHSKLELDVMLKIEHNEINFGRRDSNWKTFMKRISEANTRIKHSWDLNAQQRSPQKERNPKGGAGTNMEHAKNQHGRGPT